MKTWLDCPTTFLEIPRAAWIVDERLELEADQPFRADDAKVAKCGLELPCSRQQTAGNGAARVQEVDVLVAARIVGGVRAAMEAAITQLRELGVDVVGPFRLRQQIDILSRADHFVRCERQTADQREPHAVRVQRRGDFGDLLAETGDGHR